VIGVRSVLPPTLPLVAQTAIAIAVRTRQLTSRCVGFVFRARVKTLILGRAQLRAVKREHDAPAAEAAGD